MQTESQWTGIFKVLINGSAIEASGDSIVVEFNGQGFGKGKYVIAAANIGKREPFTLNTTGAVHSIDFKKGQESRMVIPEEGAKSLPIHMSFEESEDYFITSKYYSLPAFYVAPISLDRLCIIKVVKIKRCYLIGAIHMYDQVLRNIYAVSKTCLTLEIKR